MQCVICKQGDIQAGQTTITLERNTTLIVFKYVPADICELCGESYTDAETTRKLLHMFEEAVQEGIEVQVRSYRAM